jgi:hypothetical protein
MSAPLLSLGGKNAPTAETPKSSPKGVPSDVGGASTDFAAFLTAGVTAAAAQERPPNDPAAQSPDHPAPMAIGATPPSPGRGPRRNEPRDRTGAHGAAASSPMVALPPVVLSSAWLQASHPQAASDETSSPGIRPAGESFKGGDAKTTTGAASIVAGAPALDTVPVPEPSGEAAISLDVAPSTGPGVSTKRPAPAIAASNGAQTPNKAPSSRTAGAPPPALAPEGRASRTASGDGQSVSVRGDATVTGLDPQGIAVAAGSAAIADAVTVAPSSAAIADAITIASTSAAIADAVAVPSTSAATANPGPSVRQPVPVVAPPSAAHAVRLGPNPGVQTAVTAAAPTPVRIASSDVIQTKDAVGPAPPAQPVAPAAPHPADGGKSIRGQHGSVAGGVAPTSQAVSRLKTNDVPSESVEPAEPSSAQVQGQPPLLAADVPVKTVTVVTKALPVAPMPAAAGARLRDALVSVANQAVLRGAASGQIDVPELGRIAVRAHSMGGSIDVEVTADRPDARATLRGHVAAMTADLHMAAVPVGRFTVDRTGAAVGNSAGSSTSSRDRDANTGGDSTRNSRPQTDGDGASTLADPSAAPRRVRIVL